MLVSSAPMVCPYVSGRDSSIDHSLKTLPLGLLYLQFVWEFQLSWVPEAGDCPQVHLIQCSSHPVHHSSAAGWHSSVCMLLAFLFSCKMLLYLVVKAMIWGKLAWLTLLNFAGSRVLCISMFLSMASELRRICDTGLASQHSCGSYLLCVMLGEFYVSIIRSMN